MVPLSEMFGYSQHLDQELKVEEYTVWNSAYEPVRSSRTYRS
jgi:hypothetical protein